MPLVSGPGPPVDAPGATYPQKLVRVEVEDFASCGPGYLLIAECVRPQPVQPGPVEFMFNLARTFGSPRLHPVHRPSGGFLTPVQWKGAIESVGFAASRFLPDMMAIREQARGSFVAATGAMRGSG